jgi:hypothetical protein
MEKEIKWAEKLDAQYERDMDELAELNKDNPDWYAPSFFDWCVAQTACGTLEEVEEFDPLPIN